MGGAFPVTAISGLEGLQEALGGGFLWAYFRETKGGTMGLYHCRWAKSRDKDSRRQRSSREGLTLEEQGEPHMTSTDQV